MKSLYDLINAELKELSTKIKTRYDKLDLFITDDKQSADFINSLAEYNEYESPDKNSQLYQIAQGRARHSAVTFLTGLVFKKFGGIYDNIDNVLNRHGSAFKLWLMTSLNHDIGYTSEYIKKEKLKYNETFKNYYLLADKYDKMPELDNFCNNYPNSIVYTYQEIENYDNYARDYHKDNNDGRRLDHGILGGIILFSRLIGRHIKNTEESKSSQNDIDTIIIKASALTIAQHNIYKSNKKDTDIIYMDKKLNRLLSTSDLVIDKNHALLLLLSLVDTIECVKKYSKKENETNSMQTLTVLKNIKVDVSENEIIIDYSDLSAKEKDTRNNDNICKSIIDNINNLKYWTCFNVTCIDNKAYISLHSENQAVETKISA